MRRRSPRLERLSFPRWSRRAWLSPGPRATPRSRHEWANSDHRPRALGQRFRFHDDAEGLAPRPERPQTSCSPSFVAMMKPRRMDDHSCRLSTGCGRWLSPEASLRHHGSRRAPMNWVVDYWSNYHSLCVCLCEALAGARVSITGARIAGKFEQLRRDEPLLALRRAFAGLTQRRQTAPACRRRAHASSTLRHWR